LLVGIDEIAVSIPGLYVDILGDFCKVRGIKKEKLQKGLGVEQFSYPDSHQDAATMGAMAVLKLIRQAELDPKDIGRIYIGTESSVDESKSIGGYIVGMLEKVLGEGSLEHVGSVEYKFACIGTTYALEGALNWIRSGEAADKYAVVVSTDVARYELESPGEYTQGAGAVAMLLKEEPKLLAIEPRLTGIFTKDENDFYRPTGQSTAVVNGKHSNACYLNAMKSAMMMYSDKFKDGHSEMKDDHAVSDFVDYFLFHIPYPRMAEYAAAFLFRHEWRDLPRWKNIVEQIGEEPKREDFETVEEFHVADYKYRKEFTALPEFNEAYGTKIKPSIQFAKRIGNIYTGSLYLALCSILEMEKENELEGKRIGLGSYGSGCSCMVFSGIVQPRYKEALDNLDIKEKIESRKELSMVEYEALHTGQAKHSVLEPHQEFALKEVDEQGYRHYIWMD